MKKRRKVFTKKEIMQQVNFTLHGVMRNLETQARKAAEEGDEKAISVAIFEVCGVLDSTLKLIAARRKSG